MVMVKVMESWSLYRMYSQQLLQKMDQVGNFTKVNDHKPTVGSGRLQSTSHYNTHVNETRHSWLRWIWNQHIPVWLIMTVCESMPYWFSTNIVMLVQLCDTGSVYCTLPLIGTSCIILSDWLLHILVRTMLKFTSPSKHWISYVRGKQNISLRTKAGIKILPSVILAVNHLYMIHWIYHRLELVG